MGIGLNYRLMPQANRLKLPTASAKRQAENKILWNHGRSADAADFFTFGYTGRKTEELLDTLLANGVRTLVDVRQMPSSMVQARLE